MFFDYRHKTLNQVRSALSLAIVPFEWVIQAPIDFSEKFFFLTQDKLTLSEENSELRKSLFELRTELQTLENLKSENTRLRSLLGSSKILPNKTLIGKLMSVQMSPLNHKVVINKGSTSGIKLGQPILDAHGIMGQVIEVNPVTSVALLVTDYQHAVPAKFNRTGIKAIVRGTGNWQAMQIAHLPETTDIKKGDILVTSGLGNRFPEGYPIGTITDIRKIPGEPFLDVKVSPYAQVAKSDYVLFAWPRNRNEVANAD